MNKYTVLCCAWISVSITSAFSGLAAFGIGFVLALISGIVLDGETK